MEQDQRGSIVKGTEKKLLRRILGNADVPAGSIEKASIWVLG